VLHLDGERRVGATVPFDADEFGPVVDLGGLIESLRDELGRLAERDLVDRWNFRLSLLVGQG
jgi:hypothetical protein